MKRFVVALMLLPAVAWSDLATKINAIVSEKKDLRIETGKFFALSDSSLLAFYYQSPVHKVEDGKWVNLTEAEERPAGKVLGEEFEGWGGNGGCVRKSGSTFSWFNNYRRMWRWPSTGDAYRTVLSYLTPVPSGHWVLSYVALVIYQTSPYSIHCGTELRLLTNSVPGGAEEVWDWIGDGNLFYTDQVIARPNTYLWLNSQTAGKLAQKITGGAVHIGLKGTYEGNKHIVDCGIGRWSTSDAPEWPDAWEDVGIPEPSTYGIIIALLTDDPISKPAADRLQHESWGEFKDHDEFHRWERE